MDHIFTHHRTNSTYTVLHTMTCQDGSDMTSTEHMSSSKSSCSGVHSGRPGAPMASAGPSDARTQPAWRGSATRAGEDAAARSVPVAASGVRGRVEGTLGTCTVKYQGATVSSSSASWRLARAGRTVRRGTASHGRFVLGRLDSGRYRLHIRGQKGSRLIVIS